MQEEDEDGDDLQAHVPWDVLGPVIAWMTRHGVDRLRLVAGAPPSPADIDPAREETGHLMYCEEEPDAPGLLHIYEVTDEAGMGRLNGPSRVPQAVLRPLLRALDEASVSELLIAAHSEEQLPASVVTMTETLDSEFEEHEVPMSDDWPVLIAVQVKPG